MLIVSEFIVESDGIDENTFDVGSVMALELIVSEFLVEFDRMNDNTFDGDGWIDTALSVLKTVEEGNEETVDVCKLIETEFGSIAVIIDFGCEVFVVWDSL